MFDHKIPDWLINIMFLGEVETAIRSGIQSRFCYHGISSATELLDEWKTHTSGVRNEVVW